MTALTLDRHTIEKQGKVYAFPIAANTLCHAGGLAVVLPDGTARPAIADANAAVCVPIGRFRRRYNNLTGADVMIDVSVRSTCEVESGIFRWENDSAPNAVTTSLLHQQCYALDDQTVTAANSSGGHALGYAGIVMDVDANGVWVATGLPTSL